VRRAVVAGLTITMAILLVIWAVIVLGNVVPLFTGDPEVLALVAGLLALIVLVVLGDGLQALGFGLAGLKRTTPSFVVFAACYGVLAIVAFAVPGLSGLWVALAVANLIVAVEQGLAFRKASNEVTTAGDRTRPVPPPPRQG
jgi:MATE family multidrug resistance protein